MLSDERIEQMARDHVCGGHEPRMSYEINAVKSTVVLLRAAVNEAVAAERELLEYVYQQTLGDLLQPNIKDGEMIAVYLSAGKLRQIAAIRARGEEEE